MKVFGRDVLEAFKTDHPEVGKALDAWLVIARQASWSTPIDVMQSFPKAKIVKNHVIFKLHWNKYRLDITVAYNTQKIYIKRIGTHAEYDNWEF